MLRNKLTKAMQSSSAWVQLADALEALNVENVEPILERIKGMLSVFTMHADDLQVHLNELGDIFTVGSAEDRDKPLLLQQRIDEVRQKGDYYPIEKTLEREFGNISVKWEPLFAPVDTETYPYGTVLVPADQRYLYPVPEGEWFLTSRGTIELPLFDIAENSPADETQEALDKFEAALYSVIPPLIPTHIVLEGHSYLMTWTVWDVGDRSAVAGEEVDDILHPVADIADSAAAQGADIDVSLSCATGTVPPRLYPQQYRMDAMPIDAWGVDKPLPSA